MNSPSSLVSDEEAEQAVVGQVLAALHRRQLVQRDRREMGERLARVGLRPFPVLGQHRRSAQAAHAAPTRLEHDAPQRVGGDALGLGGAQPSTYEQRGELRPAARPQVTLGLRRRGPSGDPPQERGDALVAEQRFQLREA